MGSRKRSALISQSAYGASRGISRQAVYKWVKKGVIRLRDRKVDPKQADRAISAVTNPAHERKPGRAKGQQRFAAVRTEHEQYRAALAKLELDEKTGKKVDVDAVKKVAFETGRRIREAMKNISPRVESILAAETDVARVRAILDREIDAALSDLSDEFAVPA